MSVDNGLNPLAKKIATALVMHLVQNVPLGDRDWDALRLDFVRVTKSVIDGAVKDAILDLDSKPIVPHGLAKWLTRVVTTTVIRFAPEVDVSSAGAEQLLGQAIEGALGDRNKVLQEVVEDWKGDMGGRDPRCMELARTKLEEAQFWLEKAAGHHG